MGTYVGIDFSGDVGQWRLGCSKSNVWVAEADIDPNQMVSLRALRRVQELPGTVRPFDRLAAYLRAGDFTAAAIDAPFSVPITYVPTASRSALLQLVSSLPRGGRPFALGSELIRALVPDRYPRGLKVFRQTEILWLGRGVNVRSTLWNGPRGGAPFTVACLALLCATSLPIWPWCASTSGLTQRGMILVEAFPAAQLRAWALPHDGYSKDSRVQQRQREMILNNLRDRAGLLVAQKHADLMVASADALDAVVCVYAAKAASEGLSLDAPAPEAAPEGWIAVHK